MRRFAAFAIAAALVAVTPFPASADVIDDEPTPGLEPARRPAPAPPPPPPPPRTPAPPPPPPKPMAKPAPAPAPAPAPMAAEDLWRFEVAGWLWMNSVNGDNVVQGVPVHIDATLNNAFSDFDTYTAGGRGEVWRDRIGAFVEGGWGEADGGDIATVVGFDIDYHLERAYVDFGFSYQALVHELDDERLLTLEPYVGGRWARYEQRASAGLGPAFRARSTHNYMEPFVGARLVMDLTERLLFRVGGDAGGFGVGDASDLTWNALAELGYRVVGPLSLRVGYAAQGVDYDTNNGAFKVDTIAHGPRFGLALNF